MSLPEKVQALQKQLAISENEKAYRELFEIFHSPLLKYAYSIFPSRQASEEIVSDVFIKIWERRKELDKIENLKLYLFKATHNTAINYLRNHRKYHSAFLFNFERGSISPYPDPEQIMMNSELEARLYEAIQGLPPKCRQIFLLAKIYKIKYKGIAEIMNISVNTIDNQLAIAVKKIALAINVKLRNKNSRSFY